MSVHGSLCGLSPKGGAERGGRGGVPPPPQMKPWIIAPAMTKMLLLFFPATFSRRSNSLPQRFRGQGASHYGPSIGSLADIEGGEEGEEEEGEVEGLAGLDNVLGGKHNRSSTRRLKERIDMQ